MWLLALLLAACGNGDGNGNGNGRATPSPDDPAVTTATTSTPPATCTAVGCSSGAVVELDELAANPGLQGTVCIDGVCGTAAPRDGAWWSAQISPTDGSEAPLVAGGRTTLCIDSKCSQFEAVATDNRAVPTCVSSEQITNDAGETVLVCLDIATTPPRPDLGLRPVELGAAGSSATVRVIVSDGSSTVADLVLTTPYVALQPNGPRCEPTCWRAIAHDDAATARLVATSTPS